MLLGVSIKQHKIMKLLINFLISSIMIYLAITFLPGIDAHSTLTAATVASVLGLANISIKPFLILFDIIPTLFTIVFALFFINGAIVVLSDWIIDDFSTESLWYVILFSAVISVLDWCIHKLVWRNH